MNLDIYTTEMSKSIWDKAFFMDKVPGVRCIIDFGCADGAMIRYLAPLFPDITFVGYDISQELIDRARRTSPFYHNVVFFCGSEKRGAHNCISYVKDLFVDSEICINFSSVLHEIFSCSASGKAVIKTMVEEIKPQFITIRDMYFHKGTRHGSSYTRSPQQAWFEDAKDYINAFEHVYGSINNEKELMHFLMKYRWKDNGWETEMNENYFSWKIEDFEQLVDYRYTTVFENYYQLPYLTQLWSDNFFQPNLHTHAQFILRRDN